MVWERCADAGRWLSLAIFVVVGIHGHNTVNNADACSVCLVQTKQFEWAIPETHILLAQC